MLSYECTISCETEQAVLIQKERKDGKLFFAWQSRREMFKAELYKFIEGRWEQIGGSMLYTQKYSQTDETPPDVIDTGLYWFYLFSYDANYAAALRDKETQAGVSGGYGVIGSVHLNRWLLQF